MERYHSFGEGTSTDTNVVVGQGERDEDVEEGGRGGETGPLLVQRHPVLPVLVRCLSSPWSNLIFFTRARIFLFFLSYKNQTI